MNKKTLIAFLLVFSLISCFSLVNASTEQDFLDSVDITITVGQDSSTVRFDLNTLGKDFDTQTINIGASSHIPFQISSFLNGLSWNLELTDGQKPHFHDFNIDNGLATTIMGLIFGEIEGPTVADVNNDVLALNNYLESANTPLFDGSHTTFTKQGTQYTLVTDNGYADSTVEQIVSSGLGSVSVPILLNQLFSMIVPAELNETLEELGLDLNDLDYNLSCADLSGVRLEDGTYPVAVEINCDGIHTEQITLILFGIVNEETGVSDSSGDYLPVEAKIKNYLLGISGLGAGNNIEVSLFDVNPFPAFSLPSNIQKIIKFMEITVTSNTDAVIEFKVPVTDVENPSLVSLYVFKSGAWTKLPTTFISTNGSFHKYTSTTPHFSTFMIMEEESSTSGGSGGSNRARTPPVTEQDQAPPKENTTPISAGPTDAEAATRGFFAGITGAVIGVLGGSSGVFIVVFIVAIVGLVVLLRTTDKLNRKSDANAR